MDAKKRFSNERDFSNWEDNGTGRKYWFDIKGRSGGFARYVKVVDYEESTISFVQEIYDPKGILIEIHEKYPVDKGHKKICDDDNEKVGG